MIDSSTKLLSQPEFDKLKDKFGMTDLISMDAEELVDYIETIKKPKRVDKSDFTVYYVYKSGTCLITTKNKAEATTVLQANGGAMFSSELDEAAYKLAQQAVNSHQYEVRCLMWNVLYYICDIRDQRLIDKIWDFIGKLPESTLHQSAIIFEQTVDLIKSL